jgi:hypothetical protein
MGERAPRRYACPCPLWNTARDGREIVRSGESARRTMFRAADRLCTLIGSAAQESPVSADFTGS